MDSQGGQFGGTGWISSLIKSSHDYEENSKSYFKNGIKQKFVLLQKNTHFQYVFEDLSQLRKPCYVGQISPIVTRKK